METFIKGTTLDYILDFQDLLYSDMDSIRVDVILNGSPIGIFTIDNGYITAGSTVYEAALTIPGAITNGWYCGEFYLLLYYEWDGNPVKIEKIEGGIITDGY